MRKHSITIRGHRTSYSLEEAFRDELAQLAAARGLSLATLIAEVDAARPTDVNLSSALRLHVLEALRGRAAPVGADRPTGSRQGARSRPGSRG